MPQIRCAQIIKPLPQTDLFVVVLCVCVLQTQGFYHVRFPAKKKKKSVMFQNCSTI